MSDKKTIAIMAGGTGGHIFPGVAVAKALMKQGHRVLWLGSKGGMEERIVRQEGVPLTLISMKALRGKGIKGLLVLPFKLTKGIWQARRFFKKNQVDLAISMGGFVAAPGGFATRLCSTKLAVHEQNSVFGMTNKHLSKHADLVLTGFDLNGLNNSVWVGNPVRAQIEALGQQVKHRHTPLRVLVLGGSLGAQSLNQVIPNVLKHLITDKEIEVLHQCGRNKLKATKEAYGNLSVEIKEFINNMASAYEWADVCICRAGALTIAEITMAGIPAVYVPYPSAVDDHQTHNAMSLVKNGAALLWQESEGQAVLETKVEALLSSAKQAAMRESLQGLNKTHVANDIAARCVELLK
ncbi:undecaprenyldiphospho-muramoylpentapeptide beta-N-acetylglucosaminyltransferase [Marinicella rhabdoformis]|uniref:undecaprenyldiphospho-muramoylpentapeptide beta-N-acetylglucosaminyltransferase n=1 Tax=Marinicella rhabdoformis TaxID=2580566 RepID=UPI0012AEC50E|nr:undecaprenyldiphospho-muramoylpentapeptide beta-N-acetylglucosaminyltransferase [Marinicella rhabdoformis]